MSRSKRKSADTTRPRKQPPEAGGRKPRVAACPSCGTPARADANFCHKCGAALEGTAAGGRSNVATIVLFAAIVAAVFAATLGAALYFGADRFGAPPQSASRPAAPAPGTMPDIASMPPREAADRLFNRVMMAESQGNMEEALQFAPMALQAYEQVGQLDADAHYHLGLIHAVAGDIDGVREQVRILKGFAPNHLLALTLEFDIAERTGDAAAAGRTAAAFAAAYASEIATGRPEYDAHRTSIENFRSLVATPPPPAESMLESGPNRGAALFAMRCGGCHGQRAAGSANGPPLVHEIYEPGHHDDAAFRRAVREGVEAHHWAFGHMPPIDGLSDDEIADIIVYVRALQVVAGIR